jgi:hypothetical protein
MAKMSIQGGVDNYLGKQETINNIPIKWKSRPGKPATELAYITKAEKDLLLKKDLHGSLKDGPNTGPGGIMSLDSAGGSYGSPGSGTGRDSGNSGRESGSENNRNQSPPSRTTSPPPDRGPNEPDNKPGRTPIDTSRYTTDTQDRNNRAAIEKGKKEYAAAAKKATAKKKKIEEEKKKKQEKLNLKIASDKDLRLFDKNKDGILGFFERHTKRRNDNRRKRQLSSAEKYYLDIEQYADPYDAIGYSNKEIQDIISNSNNPNYNPSFGYDFSPENMPGGKGMETMTSNKGTSLEKTRKNLYSVNSKIPFFKSANYVANKIRPDTSVTAMNTLQKARDYNFLAGKELTTTEDMRDIRNRGRTEEQIRFLENPTGTGGYEAPNSYGIPFIPIPDNEEEEDNQEVDYTQNVIYDDYGKPGYRTTRAAEGGIMGTRARRAMGGIMERVDKRQGYFLGKIVKGVGKAIGSVADAAGKVLKSDFGKYAIMAAGMYYGGGGASMFKSGGLKGMAGNFMSTKNPLLFNADGALSLSKLSGVSAVLPYLFGDTKPNEGNFSDRGGSLIDPLTGKEATPAEMRENIELAKLEAGDDPDKLAAIDQKYNNMLNLQYQAGLPDATPYLGYGESGYRTTAAEGGLMDLGGMEKDYRAEGGFVPIGEYEKKDDVPARLSVNEFVMTADAVRGAGQGDIDKGAEIMENMMKNLEKGGTISEESQGNIGAQQMFETSERLGEVI